MDALPPDLFSVRTIDPDLAESFLGHVSSFEHDRYRSMERQRNALAIAAGILTLAIGTMAFAIGSLAPLKTVVPMVFTEDRVTGLVARNVDIDGSKIPATDSLNRAYANQYVMARESFVPGEVNTQLQAVALLSSSEEAKRYTDWLKRSSDSPMKTLTTKDSIRVRVKSITLLSDPSIEADQGIMQVRFDRAELRAGDDTLSFFDPVRGCVGPVNSLCKPYIATIHFSRIKGPLNEYAALQNPLGWVVTEYDARPEVAQ